MERKLDVDKERDMTKYLWDDCIPHDFYQGKPNLTYQKASNIFKNYLLEELNRINMLKYKQIVQYWITIIIIHIQTITIL